MGRSDIICQKARWCTLHGHGPWLVPFRLFVAKIGARHGNKNWGAQLPHDLVLRGGEVTSEGVKIWNLESRCGEHSSNTFTFKGVVHYMRQV